MVPHIILLRVIIFSYMTVLHPKIKKAYETDLRTVYESREENKSTIERRQMRIRDKIRPKMKSTSVFALVKSNQKVNARITWF